MRSTVAENGGVVSTMVVTAHQEYAARVQDYLGEQYSDWGFTQKAEGEEVQFTGTRVFGSNDTVLEASPPEKPRAQVTIKQEGLSLVYEFVDPFQMPPIPDDPSAQRTAATIAVTYTLTMPGPIEDAASASRIEGNTAIWNLTAADRDTDIAATARASQVPRLLVFLVCVAGLVAGYLLVARPAS